MVPGSLQRLHLVLLPHWRKHLVALHSCRTRLSDFGLLDIQAHFHHLHVLLQRPDILLQTSALQSDHNRRSAPPHHPNTSAKGRGTGTGNEGENGTCLNPARDRAPSARLAKHKRPVPPLTDPSRRRSQTTFCASPKSTPKSDTRKLTSSIPAPHKAPSRRPMSTSNDAPKADALPPGASEHFLRTRASWMKEQKKRPSIKRRDFMRFLNLQRHEDLLLWVRIRQLLVETHSGFKSTQGDIIVTYMLLTVVFFSSWLFLQSGKESSNSIFCMRARVEVVVFSLLLIAIVNLKLSIHALRKSDVGFLHKEHYTASLAESAQNKNVEQRTDARTQQERSQV